MSKVNIDQIKGITGGGTGAGAPGLNAFNATPTFQQNNDGLLTVITGAYGGWQQIGQAVFVETGGYYSVAAINGNNLTLSNLSNNIPSGAIVGPGLISPAGVPGSGSGAITTGAIVSIARWFIYMGG